MSVRHWFLVAATLIAFVALWPAGEPSLSDMLLLFAGGLAGVWASEGVHVHAKARGIEMDPL